MMMMMMIRSAGTRTTAGWLRLNVSRRPTNSHPTHNPLTYTTNNNKHQVLYQLKILTTAVFAVLLLRRRLDCGKWLALGLLVGGVSLVQLSNLSGSSSAASTTAPPTGNTMLGLACVLLACCSSGFAGIWFEKVLKGSECSVWVRNVELALIGGIAGLVGIYGTADAAKVAANGFFQGYSPLVWSVILLQALGGIVVAVVVKYADNILKGFATSVSIVLSCLVSYAVFGEVELSGQFLLGTGLVILSTLMYSTGGSPADLCGLSGKLATPNAATAAEGGSSLSSSSSAGASKTGEGAAGGGGIFGAHGAGAVGGLMKGAIIPLTDPEEGRGLLMQEIELTESGADGGEGATPSPRPDATGHRRRALFG